MNIKDTNNNYVHQMYISLFNLYSGV